MESASATGMAQEPYDYEDPEPPANEWMLPVGLMVALIVLGSIALKETTGRAFWPSTNAQMRALPKQDFWTPVGTSGSGAFTSTDAAELTSPLVRDVETITGLSDPRGMVGQKVEFHVPVAWRANDQAFWIGERGNRLLVVPARDRRDTVDRQRGLPASNDIAPLAQGEMATISGTIERLPTAEEMFSWGLTRDDRREARAAGVYLHVDRISVR